MKRINKILLIMLSFLLITYTNAEELEEKNVEEVTDSSEMITTTGNSERTEANNYGVNKNWTINSSNMSNVLKTPLVDASLKIYDYANILSEEEEQKVKSLISEYIEKTGMDMVFVSINMPYSSDHENEDYAADFYDYNDFGLDYKNYSGVILFRNTYPSDPFYNAYTTGDAQIYFSDSRCDDVLDAIYNDFVSHNYLVGMKKFINELSLFYDDGIPQGYEEAYIDETGNLVIPKHYNPPYLIAAIIGLFTTGITTKVLVSKNKMVYKAKDANRYLDLDSVKYSKKESHLISTNTVSHYNPPHESSGSHYGGGGSSHSFGGSSGIGHSGGGRHG